MLAIVHATVIDGTGAPALSDMTLLIREGRIIELGPTSTVTPKEQSTILDATGKFVIPGLWDMHAHTGARASTFDLYLANGVTGLRDMGCDPKCTASLRARRDGMAGGEEVGPRIVFAGPNLDGSSPIDYPGHLHVTPESARATVDQLMAAGSDFIKVRDWLSPEEYSAVIDAAAANHLPVVGHVPVSVSSIEVVQAGQRSVEHGGSMLGGLLMATSTAEEELRAKLLAKMSEAREVGRMWPPFAYAMGADFLQPLLDSQDSARAQQLTQAFQSQGTAWVPTLIVTHPAFRSSDPVFDGDPYSGLPRMRFVPQELIELWRGNRMYSMFDGEDRSAYAEYQAALKRLVGRMFEAGVPILAGTDAGLMGETPWQVPGFSLHDELVLLVEAGLTPLEAIHAATGAATRFLGIKDVGTIEADKVADLVILDADPEADIRNTRSVDAVIIGGIRLDRSALDDLLARVEHAVAGSQTPGEPN